MQDIGLLSYRDVGLHACCRATLLRWSSRESVIFPHDIGRWCRHKDLSQERGTEKLPEGLESLCVAVATLGTLDSSSRASGGTFQPSRRVLTLGPGHTWEGWLQKAGSLTSLKMLEQKEFMDLVQGVLSVLSSWI